MITPLIQRQSEEEEEEEFIQTRELPGKSPKVTPTLSSNIQNLKGGGQPLPESVRAYFEPRFGYDFSQVRVHNGNQAAEAARAVNARAFTMGRDLVFGFGQYAPRTTQGRRLLAHELMHVLQQSSVPHRQVLMRDLAQEPPSSVPEHPELTAAQVRAAIRYNRASYNGESTRLIQNIVGGPITGRFEEQTVRLVALIQRQFGLVRADGKVGPDTYDFLIRELQAESVTPGTCLTMFQIVGPRPLAFFRNSSTQGTIGSRFDVHTRFDPRCNCADFEYRQYIAGSVDIHDVAGGTSNVNPRFNVPGGLSSTLKEDGDTAIASGIAGYHYGHRNYSDNASDNRDRYLPDRSTGCEYIAHDFPELTPIPAAAGDSGDIYDWTMRFRGVIRRRGHGVIEEKYWVIRGPVVIP